MGNGWVDCKTWEVNGRNGDDRKMRNLDRDEKKVKTVIGENRI